MKTINVNYNYYFELDENFNNEEKIKEYRETQDIEIRNEIITNNLPLVFKIAKKYEIATKQEWPDLAIMGILGLYRAVESYRPLGSKFSTYAYTTIGNTIVDEVQREYGQGSIRYGSFIMRYRQLASTIFGDNDSIYKPENIKYVLDIMEEENTITKQLRPILVAILSTMQEEINEEEQEEVIYEEYKEEDDYQTRFIRDNYELLTSKLNAREKELIEYIYSPNSKKIPLREYASIKGITPQAISYTHTKAIEKMRKEAVKIK